MFFNTYVTSEAQVQEAAALPSINEVLLEPLMLARQGVLTQPQLFEYAQLAQSLGLQTVLVWDILMTEAQLTQISDRLSEWNWDLFDAIRVSDVGAAQWLQEHLSQKKLHLNVETGNHNLVGLQAWCELFQSTLDRLVLSIELPQEKLAQYCQQLPVDCELMVTGRILLFYSPRSLIKSAMIELPEDAIIQTSIQTDEYGDRHFPTQESIHGTLMYLDKEQFLLDHLQDLEACGFHTVRLDLRHFSESERQALPLPLICDLATSSPDRLKAQWPYSVRAPFFKANRTTAVFPRLKSKLAPLRDETCVAECIGSKNGEYGVFKTLHSFERDQVVALVLPTKQRIELPDWVTFQTIDGQELGACDANRTIIMSWMKRLASGSILMTR